MRDLIFKSEQIMKIDGNMVSQPRKFDSIIKEKVAAICNRCNGSGNGSAKNGRCWKCKGRGKVWVNVDDSV